jgi:malate permease and related proteins
MLEASRNMLAELAAILLPVAACVAIGFWLDRRGLSLPRREVSILVADIGAPCLVFHSLATAGLDASVLARMAGAASLAVLAFFVVGYGFVRAAGWPVHTFVPPVIFANTGNMGLPLCLFAFGEDAMGLAVACFAVFTVFQFSLGLWLWSGKQGILQMLRSPVAWATVLGFACAALAVKPPLVVTNTTRLIGGMTIPLMLITLGISLASMRSGNLRRAVAISILRLTLGPAVGFALAWLFGFEGDARGVLVLECAMPVAVFNYLLALRYERDAEEVAGLIVVSTALSVLTIPALVVLLL